MTTLSLRTAAVTALVLGLAASGQAWSDATATRPASTSESGLTGNLHAADPDPTVGHWKVTQTANDAYTVTWTAPEALPVTDDRPVFETDGTQVAVPELGADGKTLSVDLVSDTPPDTSDLDVVLSGRVLDATVPPPAPQPDIIPPLPGTTSLTPDPGQPGAHPITSSDYTLPGVKMPGMPAEIEMLGHIVRPTDATAGAPVVLFLHGRHDFCYFSDTPTGSGDQEWPCPEGTSPVPSYLGYVYIQNLLASQGYVTVSISANGINAQDFRLADGGAAARAELIRKHLEAWLDPANAATIGPAVTADLTNVVLVGHSRGGEGANRASAEIPLSAPYRISGQVLIGPTDFGRQAAPFVPTVTVLPYCDGDVSDLQGQIFTDTARDYVPGDNALHSSVMVLGANHNFFNTEWTPGLSQAPSFDDWFGAPNATCSAGTPSRLTKKEQRAVGRSYVAGAVALMADHDTAALPLFDGSRVSLASAGDTDVRSHAVGLGRVLRSPGRNASLASPSTATTQICIGRTSNRAIATWCGRHTNSARTPHWAGEFPPGAPARDAFEMSWDAVGQDGGLVFRNPLDITGRTLHLRTIVDPAQDSVSLSVRVIDTSGHESTVPVADLPSLPRGAFVLSKRWAQDLSVHASAFAPAVDRTQIAEVHLVSRSDAGRVWVLDVAAGNGSLPAVPAKRAGRLSLSNVSIPEGDVQGTTMARVPFHIDGDVSHPTRFRVAPAGFFGFRFGPPMDVFVPAGDRDGFVRIPYKSNRLDDLPHRDYDLAAYGVAGAMPTDYTARLRILDDDPAPTVTVRARRSPIHEGWAARWTLRLSKPLNYFDTVTAKVVPGPSSTDGLRADDVPRSWLRDHLFRGGDPGSKPLDQLPLFLVASVKPGQREVTIGIPVKRDHQHEDLEHVTLKMRLDHVGASGTQTIQVQNVPFAG